ncbi:MAG: nuclear transport factor 2 family protein [Pseudomonadota bacterium]
MRVIAFFVFPMFWPAVAVSVESKQPILDAYFTVFETKTADHLPLADDATFFGALLAEPIVGRDQVIAFLNRVAPSVQLKDIKQAYEGDTGGCAELVFVFEGQGVTLEEAHCLTISDGKITAIRLYFDPRPLLEASAP